MVKAMSLLEIFKREARDSKVRIGIGLGTEGKHNLKIYRTALSFLEESKSKILLFGAKPQVSQIQDALKTSEINENVLFVETKNPYIEILKFLVENKIDSIIRGCISSSEFLPQVKLSFNKNELHRLALLETSKGFQFFYGPVGIDECNTYEDKVEFIKKAESIITSLKLKPKISVLSGGRISDIGRNPQVDKSIREAEKIISFFKNKQPSMDIIHDKVLIENSIRNRSNLIIAPDGISGNLIYRTLVHLGGGRAYGAIYMGIKKPIIDTSRVGGPSEIYGGLLIASTLSS
ncbi:MAG: methanogenesis marker protein Mmp4/MtxX [Candidatus Lokiarchaeota archaeon]|nr:methanogenesis marker protein Mmp4/MtxX [Candidatus Lokiarchaeota archaeon]MBD3340976.1 methanogenesis marker protein Mmp4/MtxX [Candidatus Lokiarchaeota archaeon]